MLRTVFALAAVHIALAETKAKGPAEDAEGGWLMPRHSFVKTLTYDNTLDRWYSSGSSMALRSRVQLLPGVPERSGILWNKDSLRTPSFETIVRFVAGAAKTTKPTWAFWVSEDNFTATYDEKKIIGAKDWKQGLEEQKLTLLGNRPNFKGLGVIFSSLDKTGKSRPSVTGVYSTGKTDVIEGVAFPADRAKTTDPLVQTKFVDWRTYATVENPGQLKVRVKALSKSSAEFTGWLQLHSGDASSSEKPDWIEIFSFKVDREPKESFIGFSGWSGAGKTEAKPKGGSADEISVSGVDVRNLDPSVMGEDLGVDELGQGAEDWMKMLAADKHFISQSSQTQAISKLTEMIDTHMKRYSVMGQRLQKSLVTVSNKMTHLEEKTKVLRKEVQLSFGNSSNKDVSSMKDDIKGLRKIFSADSMVHHNNLKKVHEAVQDVKDSPAVGGQSAQLAYVATKAEALKAQAEISHSQTNWMMCFLVLSVIGIGIGIWNRMRYYEKKHFL